MIDIYSPTSADGLSIEEGQLYDLIMSYRAANGLPAIPLSANLTATAGRHAVDTLYNIWDAGVTLPAGANLHSWSDAPYYSDHSQPEVMWNAPGRLGLTYPSAGFEISAAGYADIAAALEGWKTSPGHNSVILNLGSWASSNWTSIGIGVETDTSVSTFGGKIYHVWFGTSADPATIAPGDDVLVGGTGNDVLFGGAGNDVFHGKEGGDYLDGGTGNDIFHLTDALDWVIERVNEGFDTVNAHHSFTLPDHVEALNLQGTAYFGAGNALDNSMLGTDGDNFLWGAGGNDIIYALGGNDLLQGGTGNDQLNGGHGNDVFYATEGYDIARGETGDDQIYGGATAGDYLSAFGGAGNDTISGTQLNADYLAGESGADFIYGFGGDDLLTGGSGNDYLQGGAGNDQFLFQFDAVAGDIDSVGDFTIGQDTLVLSTSVQGSATFFDINTDAFVHLSVGGGDYYIGFSNMNAAALEAATIYM